MNRDWILFAVFLHIISSSCPNGYILQWHGLCTALVENGGSHTYANLHSDAVALCDPTVATPVLIRDQQEQDYWANIAKNYSNPIALGIRCNKVTAAWEWDDGSKVDYKPSNVASILSGNCNSKAYNWYMTPYGFWAGDYGTSNATFEIYCMTPVADIIPADNQCGDFESDDGACYQVGVRAETWIEAQTICKSFGGNVASVHNAQENSYIRRLAVSRGQINGVLLGASILGKSDNFSWIDGTPWDFNNMMPGFPIDGLGSCLAMDTNEVGGHWVNVDCSDEMPFMCVRRPNDVEPSCGNSVYTEGELIYSPGFPNNASIPCDFFLKVDAHKLVEVEILLLEANSCCDRLILSEGSLGGNTIVSLTGDVASGTKYKTTSSNVMRVSWQPNGGVGVRGMMITFRGV